MCEFKVYSGPEGRQQLIAEDIINAKLDENSVVLSDILGGTTKVEGALIAEVDVKKESLRVYSSPFIFDLFTFFVSCERRDRRPIDQLESTWKALKKRGDQVIGSLKSTKEGA